MRIFVITFLLSVKSLLIVAQNIPVEGYVYESGNRGYLAMVTITIHNVNNVILKSVQTDKDGFFSFIADAGSQLTLNIDKPLYDSQVLNVTIPKQKEKHFVNVEMKRSPGYLFEVTIAAEKSKDEETANGLKGYRIDVYNNTHNKEEFVLEEYNQPVFQVPLIKENHYTVLIRKDGYMSKRIEAFVDIEGCILCFEGLGSVGPGVSQNLSEQNTIGVLLANITMIKAYKGKKMQINDLYYDLGKWDLKAKSKTELDNLATLMKDNPRLIVELGSHTDSRGSNKNNLILSEKRAQSAVDYLVVEQGIERTRISAKGYGESNLLNECNDSIYCIEKDHLINRRTEIQIVGIADEMRYKSLAEIKRSENMDALLQEIQFGEQFMVPVYDAQQDSLLTAKQDSIAKSLMVNVVIEEEDGLVQKEFIEEDNSNSLSEIEFEVDIAEDVELEGNVKSDDLSSRKLSQKDNLSNQLSDLKYEKVISSSGEVTVKEKVAKTSLDNKNNVDQKIKKNTALVKIVLFEEAESLPRTHDIYTTHKGVKEIYHNGKFKYLFGDFETMAEAKNFLNLSIKMVYPNAYVVKFN